MGTKRAPPRVPKVTKNEEKRDQKSGRFCTTSSKAFLMTLGVENGGKITRNRSERGSGSENGDFFAKKAEVQQTPCFTSPNGSPQDPKFVFFLICVHIDIHDFRIYIIYIKHIPFKSIF